MTRFLEVTCNSGLIKVVEECISQMQPVSILHINLGVLKLTSQEMNFEFGAAIVAYILSFFALK